MGGDCPLLNAKTQGLIQSTSLATRIPNGMDFDADNRYITSYQDICLPQLHNRFFKHLEYTQYLVLVGGDCPLSNAKTQGRIQASSKPYVTNITCHIAVYFMLGSSKSKRQNITQ